MRRRFADGLQIQALLIAKIALTQQQVNKTINTI